MQFIYDDLVAMIVATTTVLLLFTIQSRATQNNVAKISRNAMKEQAQTFATWLEKDIQRIGKNMDREEKENHPPFDNPQSAQLEGGGSYTSQFTFYRDRVDDDEEKRIATRYQIEKTQEDPRPLLQLTRKTKQVGEGSWSSADVEGRSTASLGYFQIQMLDRNANSVSAPADNLDQVHSLRVRFSVVSPVHNKEAITQATHVGSVLMLRNGNSENSTEIDVPTDWRDCIAEGWKELTYPDGSEFSCAASCMYMASGGSKGSNNCDDDDNGDDDDDDDDDNDDDDDDDDDCWIPFLCD